MCAESREFIDALTPALEATSATERADTIDIANEELRSMLAELRTLVPDTEDADALNLWISDFETHVGDRQDYADRLREDEQAEFLVSAREGTQISRGIDRFASVNQMESCETPDDV